MNNARLRALTPEYVNRASGLELHQFKWLGDERLIGELPRRWNHLVGYDPPTESAALLHFTLGGPYFEDCADGEHSDLWRAEYARMCSVGQARAAGRDAREKAVGEGFLPV